MTSGLWATVMAERGCLIGFGYYVEWWVSRCVLNFVLTLSARVLARNDRGRFRRQGTRSFDRWRVKGLAKGQSVER